jgi:hypothetical protein
MKKVIPVLFGLLLLTGIFYLVLVTANSPAKGAQPSKFETPASAIKKY